MPLKRWSFEAVAVLIAASMLGYFLWRASGAANMTLPSGQPFFGDFMAFWSAGRAALDGHVAEIHERAMLWPYQQATAPDVRFYAPWNSPPTFLLIVCVLALAPYPFAAIGFLVGTALFLGAKTVAYTLPSGAAFVRLLQFYPTPFQSTTCSGPPGRWPASRSICR